MKPTARDDNDFTCLNVGEREVKGTEYEACFTDNYKKLWLFQQMRALRFQESMLRILSLTTDDATLRLRLSLG